MWSLKRDAGVADLVALGTSGFAAHKFGHGPPRRTARPADILAAPGVDHVRGGARALARERIRHDGAWDHRRRPRWLVRRGGDQPRQTRARAGLRYFLPQ